MRDVVRAYIEKYRLLTENRPVLVGVSGGADSIALLTILVESGYSCIAAHCNFHLRGDESLRDEQFVREYARKLDVPFLMTDFDTRKYAADRHLSIEMAARELRYGWFEEQRAATGAQAVAVAHTAFRLGAAAGRLRRRAAVYAEGKERTENKHRRSGI